jgi:hypothetical protein
MIAHHGRRRECHNFSTALLVIALHPLSDPRIDSLTCTRSRSVRDRNLATIV